MTHTTHPADDLATVADDLGTELHRLAAEFTKVADNSATINAHDAWSRDASQLRFVAALVIGFRRTGGYDALGEAWVSAARRRLEAEEAAVHESRSTRRPGPLTTTPNVVGVPASVCVFGCLDHPDHRDHLCICPPCTLARLHRVANVARHHHHVGVCVEGECKA